VKREYTSDKEFDFRAILTSIRAPARRRLFRRYRCPGGPFARQMRNSDPRAAARRRNDQYRQVHRAGRRGRGRPHASTAGAALSSRARGKEFAEPVPRRHKREIGLYAPYFYDAVMVLALAMQQAASSEPASTCPRCADPAPRLTADIEFETQR